MMINSVKLLPNGMFEVRVDGIVLNVPDSMSNRHRQQIAEWEEDGGIIEVATEPVVDEDQVDLDTLNAMLSEDGSIVRALAVIIFKEVNKLRLLTLQAPYTMTQFKAALQNEMRIDDG